MRRWPGRARMPSCPCRSIRPTRTRWLRSRRRDRSRSWNFRPDRAAEEGLMTVVAVASVRSCGVTTLTAGLAMVWPGQRQRLVVEADPAGGVLAAASGLPPEPGLVSLAAATRRHDEPTVAFEHCQTLPDGTPILCGPPTSERARSALTMLSGLLGRLGELDADVFVDCGRFEPAASNAVLFERADLGVLVVRPRLADLHALGAFLQGRNNALTSATLLL